MFEIISKELLRSESFQDWFAELLPLSNVP